MGKHYESIEVFTDPRKEYMERIKEPSWQPAMSETESGFLCGLIREYRPKKILEVGVAAGGTTAIMMQCIEDLKLECKIYSVDYVESFHGKPGEKCGFIAEKLKSEIEEGGVSIRHKLFLGNVLPAFIDQIGDEIEFVILDTAHVLPGEILDFIAVLPFLSENAIVCLHDISLNQITEDENIATNVLFNCVAGKKMMNLLPEKNRYGIDYPNIGAVQINDDTKHYMGNVFGSLTLCWKYLPEEKELKLYRDIFNKYYDKELVHIFDNAVTFNRPHDRYMFPTEKIPKGSRILMYGAGNVGKAYYEQIMKDQYAELVCWIDAAYESFLNTKYSVSSPEMIDRVEFDYAVVASWNDDNAMAMKRRLIDSGIEEEKIIWEK